MKRLLVLAALAGCCPADRRGATTPDPAPPVGLKGVILGAAGGRAELPLVVKENAVEVDILWMWEAEGGVTLGGSTPMTLITAPTGDDQVRVGLYEQYTGATGRSMRSSIWMASFLAATTIGRDLTDFRFAAAYDGQIDGGSGGALITSGFIAAMLGTPVDPLATMTGTINPDGTVGPVGGIPHKFTAALDKGKKRLGFPVGQRMKKDANTGQTVDLVKLAQKRGAVAVEIADVYQAYELLTGQKLPVPDPIAESAMAVPAEVDRRYEALYGAWLERYQAETAKVDAIARAGRLPDGFKPADDGRARKDAAAASDLRRRGTPAAAYYRIARAAAEARAGALVSEVIARVREDDVAGARRLLFERMNEPPDGLTALDSLGRLKGETITDTLRQLSAMSHAIAAWGSEAWGLEEMAGAIDFVGGLADKDERDRRSLRTADAIVDRVWTPVYMLARGEALAQLALEAAELEKETGPQKEDELARSHRLAATFGAAAAANLEDFEALMIAGWAAQERKSEAQMRRDFTAQEPAYLVARKGFEIPRVVQRELRWEPRSRAATTANLSASILSYLIVSTLQARYYSLQLGTDGGGDVAMDQRTAFDHMLKSAELKARQHAHAAKIALGDIPLQARLHYQNARALLGGSMDDRLEALEEYWESSMVSQVAVMLARD